MWLNLKRLSEKSSEARDVTEKKAEKSPMKRVVETISNKNNVFADLKQVRAEEKNKNRENSAN